MEPKIKFDHVTKIFHTRSQDIIAVKDYSMEIQPGEFVAILGPSGCGKSTLIPLMTLWMGTDPNLRVIIVIIQAVPIICLNTLNGFTTVEQEKLELARSVGATKLQTFVYVTFMNAMPQVFTGLKLGCIFSTIGAVSADFVSRNIGLGDRIIKFLKYSNFEQSYGCIVIIALIGIIFYTIVEMIEKRVVLWKK